jgi:hypothetical protein
MTIDEFIVELQSISEEKRQLPLIIYAPNGTECQPSIKMIWENMDDFFQKGPDKMVITCKY